MARSLTVFSKGDRVGNAGDVSLGGGEAVTPRGHSVVLGSKISHQFDAKVRQTSRVVLGLPEVTTG